MGHGLLVSLENNIYLLSAAHIIVMLAGSSSIEIGFVAPIWTWKVTCGTVFVPRSYVENGSHDLGLLLVQSPSEDIPKFQSTLPNFLDNPAQVIGLELLGHGLVHLRGNAIASNDTGRILLHTPSVPGCSGAPVFGPSGELVALVHGNSKHRLGRHGFNHEDESVSPYLYADVLAREIDFLAVPDNLIPTLMAIEDVDVDEDWVKNSNCSPSDLKFPDEPELWGNIKRLLNDDSINSSMSFCALMAAVAKFIWKLDQPVQHLRLKGIQILSAPKPGEAIYKREQS
jgi:hypothetical protein